MKIFIDAGHGGSDPGAIGQVQEKNINLEVALKLRDFLQAYEGVVVAMTRVDDTYIDLIERCNRANDWGADLFISIHHNAFNGTATGVETIYSVMANETFINYANEVGQCIATNIGLSFRRAFSSARSDGRDSLCVIRETTMPALLVECLFLDNPIDWAHENPAVIAETIAQVTSRYYSLKKPVISTVFRVVAGSFSKRENAEKRVEELKAAGFDSFILPT